MTISKLLYNKQYMEWAIITKGTLLLLGIPEVNDDDHKNDIYYYPVS